MTPSSEKFDNVEGDFDVVGEGMGGRHVGATPPQCSQWMIID